MIRFIPAVLFSIYIVLVGLPAFAQMSTATTTSMRAGTPLKPAVGTLPIVAPMPTTTSPLTGSPLTLNGNYCPPGYCTAWGGTCPPGGPVATCINNIRTAAAYTQSGCTYGNISCLMSQQAMGCPPGLLGGNCVQTQLMYAQQAAQMQQQQAARQNAMAAALPMMMMGMMGRGGGGGEVLAGGGQDYGDGGGAGYSGIMSKAPYISTTDIDRSAHPILAKIQDWLPKCEEKLGLANCKFQNDGVMGDTAHQNRRSCHNSGTAMDIGAFNCGTGGRITPIGEKNAQNTDVYLELAHCMAQDTNNELQVIYDVPDYGKPGVKTSNMLHSSIDPHTGHMHIQTYNCPMTYGGGR